MIDYFKHPEKLRAMPTPDMGDLLRDIIMNSFVDERGRLTSVLAIWSRDCDLCESTDVYDYHHKKSDLEKGRDPTKVVACRMLERVDQVCFNAEGPVSYWIMSRAQLEDWLDGRKDPRDRIAEAFENGNGTSVVV